MFGRRLVKSFENFLSAYRSNAAGVKHDLVLACKGFTTETFALLRPLFSDLQPRIVMLPDVGLDLGSYRRACLVLDSEYVCFLNSFSRPLTSNWLRSIYDVTRRSNIGIAGATGSLQLEPHIRTNAFCMKRSLYLRPVTADPVTKPDACAIEVGPKSLTSRLRRELNLDARVVARNGVDFDISNARTSNTFWWGEQEGLLVADNQTDSYTNGDRHWKKMLQRAAWCRRLS